MRAGHYENRVESVEIMIHASRGIITHLLALGVRFEKMRTEALPTHGKGRTQTADLFPQGYHRGGNHDDTAVTCTET